jgi:hypothetical protein
MNKNQNLFRKSIKRKFIFRGENYDLLKTAFPSFFPLYHLMIFKLKLAT